MTRSETKRQAGDTQVRITEVRHMKSLQVSALADWPVSIVGIS